MSLRAAIFACAFFAATLSALAAQYNGSWKCVPLDCRTIALSGDYSECLEAEISVEEESVPNFLRGKALSWKEKAFANANAARVIAERRPALVRMFRDNPKISVSSNLPEKISVESTGFWLSSAGLLRGRVSVGIIPLKNAQIVYHLFLTFNRPIENGEVLKISLPTGEVAEYRARPDTEASALFKYNQVAYAPSAGKKYAYIGAWLGTAGAMPLRKYDGKPFEVADASNGKTVFEGRLSARADVSASDGVPFTGEETLEADFSELKAEGKYFLKIDGIGRSGDFKISAKDAELSFYVRARGLFHKRCGIDRHPPQTFWESKKCHGKIFRGTFPPHAEHYSADPKRGCGFFDANGNSVSVNHFALIEQNAPSSPESVECVGGWHDAADYDRRPMHLEIIGDLAAVYMLRPENFTDGQLNIPESGNSVPDILDEAVWGLKHLLALQNSDGSVGTWIETMRHPRADECLSPDKDPCVFYLSCATRASSMEYAAYAASLALALKKSGAVSVAEEFAASALRAWEFAVNPKNRAFKIYKYGGKTVFYKEAKNPPPEFVAKAAIALSAYSGRREYAEFAANFVSEAVGRMKKLSWKWSPFIWIEGELYPDACKPLEGLIAKRRQMLLDKADKMLAAQSNNYPYRTIWFSAKSPWVHTMAWGTFHQLRLARTLVFAHAITGGREYLDAARIAEDFQNGANPLGISMTSGLGEKYPARFLDLASYSDSAAEFVPGITPYFNTFGIDKNAARLVYGLFMPPEKLAGFRGASASLLPSEGLSEDECLAAISKSFPVWRRWINLEEHSVPSSEYSVWETVAPAAAVSGYLLEGAGTPQAEWTQKRPAANIKKLKGYTLLP